MKEGEGILYFARMSVWTFKKGQREKALGQLEDAASNDARTTKVIVV